MRPRARAPSEPASRSRARPRCHVVHGVSRRRLGSLQLDRTSLLCEPIDPEAGGHSSRDHRRVELCRALPPDAAVVLSQLASLLDHLALRSTRSTAACISPHACREPGSRPRAAKSSLHPCMLLRATRSPVVGGTVGGAVAVRGIGLHRADCHR